MNKVYQVIVTDKYNRRLQHIGIFRLHAHAMACMNSVVKNKDCSVSVWAHNMYEGAWDGMIDTKEDLAYTLMKETNE